MLHANTLVDLGEPEKSISCDNYRFDDQELLGSPDSFFPPSEPPDINNWFSSYEYESLVLETNDNFGFSDHQVSQGYGNECSKAKAAIENSRELFTRGKTANGTMTKKTSTMLIGCNQSEEENKCENQVLDSPDSPLFSEAVGIKNWFSSYSYESPALDTMEDLILVDHKESTVHNNGKLQEVEKDRNLDDLICNQNLEACDNESTKDGESSSELPPSNKDDGVNEILFKNAERSSPAYRNECLEANADLRQSSVGNGFVTIKGKKRQRNGWPVNVWGSKRSSCFMCWQDENEQEGIR